MPIDPSALELSATERGIGWFMDATIGEPGQSKASDLTTEATPALVRRCAADYIAARKTER
jgi:hypothetical protein